MRNRLLFSSAKKVVHKLDVKKKKGKLLGIWEWKNTKTD